MTRQDMIDAAVRRVALEWAREFSLFHPSGLFVEAENCPWCRDTITAIRAEFHKIAALDDWLRLYGKHLTLESFPVVVDLDVWKAISTPTEWPVLCPKCGANLVAVPPHSDAQVDLFCPSCVSRPLANRR